MSAGSAGAEHDDVAQTGEEIAGIALIARHRKTKISPRRHGDTEKTGKEKKLAAD
jgi:hypothetical protein